MAKYYSIFFYYIRFNDLLKITELERAKSYTMNYDITCHSAASQIKSEISTIHKSNIQSNNKLIRERCENIE